MRPRSARLIALYAVLGIIGLCCFIIPTLKQATLAVDPSGEIRLGGIVRDFRSTHPDFDIAPAAGPGHHAGNVERTPGDPRRPVFSPTGYAVDVEWRDSEDRPIAPHLYGVGAGTGAGSPGQGPALAVAGKLTADGPGTLIDGYNSSLGSYGGTNAGLPIVVSSNGTDSNIIDLAGTTITGDVLAGPGADPGTAIKINSCTITGTVGTLDGAVTIPTPVAPDDLGDSVGDVTWNGGESTLSTDLVCDKLAIDGGAVLWIDGHVTIYCTKECKVANGSEVRLAEDASLQLYVVKDFKLENGARFNANTADPSRVTEYHIEPGSDNVKIDGGSVFHGRIFGAGGSLTVSGSQFFGSFTGGELKAQGAAGIHIDLAGSACTGVYVEDSLQLKTGAFIDAFDPGLGEYGPGNEHGLAVVSTNATAAGAVRIGGGCTIHGDVLVGAGGDPDVVIESSGTITGMSGSRTDAFIMPPVIAPTEAAVGPNIGDVWYQNDDNVVISDNLHVDDLRISTRAILTISGNVTILVEGQFTTETEGSLLVPDGSSLEIYVKGKTVIKTRSRWSNPHNTSLYILGSPEFKIETESSFYGSVVAPDAHLQLKTRAGLYGSFLGRSLLAETESGIHVPGCAAGGCLVVNDVPGSPGAAGSGGITSASTFAEWFRNVDDVNRPAAHFITLRRNADTYEFLSDEFYPVDDRLFGNEGGVHNHFFTYAIRATFVHEACSGQFIEFEGGDGAWLFIDGVLAIDLGGVAPATPQFLELDRLGLSEDMPHEFGLFYAQRRASSPVFRLRTNVPLSSAGFMPDGSSMYD